MDIFEEINGAENLPPFILSKLAIAMSLKSKNPLVEDDFHRDTNGLELNRQTITGEYDDTYKCLIEMFEGRHLEDDDYFQKYLKAHLNRGAKMLYSEYKYGGDFIVQLLNSEGSI